MANSLGMLMTTALTATPCKHKEQFISGTTLTRRQSTAPYLLFAQLNPITSRLLRDNTVGWRESEYREEKAAGATHRDIAVGGIHYY